MAQHGLEQRAGSAHIIEPVPYLDMIRLEESARVVVTDSGGVQKEAFFFRVPCVTLREETEWVELVECGWNRLAPRDAAEIAAVVLSTSAPADGPRTLYGEGHASEIIVENLVRRYSASTVRAGD
jgi:UDP-GlcNAc3NAcA epimerase